MAFDAQPAYIEQAQQDPQKEAFLRAIAQNESNGGKNINHQLITSGPNKGQTAIGTYAFLPQTVREFSNRDSNLPDYTDLSDEEIKNELLNDPSKQDALASSLYNHLNSKTGGDVQRMAYGWRHGQNLNPDNISDKKLLNDDYVNKFLAHYQQPSKENTIVQQPMLRTNTPRLVSMLNGQGNSEYQPPVPSDEEDETLQDLKALNSDDEDDDSDDTSPFINNLAAAKAQQSIPPKLTFEDDNSSQSVVPISYQDHMNNLQRIKQMLGGY